MQLFLFGILNLFENSKINFTKVSVMLQKHLVGSTEELILSVLN